MAGKIVFSSYERVDELDLSDYQYKLQIVRYPTKGIKPDFMHFPALAPSEDLFNRTKRRWKQLKFTKEEKSFMATGKTGTWFDLYEVSFIHEKKRDLAFMGAFHQILNSVQHGDSFLIICYCENHERCHRKVVADMFEEAGVTVEHI